MIAAILEALFGSLIKWATGWLSEREQSRAQTKSAQAIAKAEDRESSDRDATDNQVQADREKTDAQLTHFDSDAAGPGGVQRSSEDAAAAIAAANASLRRGRRS